MPSFDPRSLTIYFQQVEPFPPSMRPTLRSRQERFFSIDYRGCGRVGTADAGYVQACKDLKDFTGNPIVRFCVNEWVFQRWHAYLMQAFPPIPGGYPVEAVCQGIGEASRLLMSRQPPAPALRDLFKPAGNPLDAWFEGSKITEKGSPQHLFRAVVSEADPLAGLPTDRPIWFGDDGISATYLGEGPDLIEVVLALKNPLILEPGQDIKTLLSLGIPEGHDGLLRYDDKWRADVAAVASPEQVRVVRPDDQELAAWLQSWEKLAPEPADLEVLFEPAAFAR
ncbi:hypothetical protein [Geopseudomonas aromaticivorans]